MAQLDPRISEFPTTEAAESHDAWFRGKVQAAMADTRALIPHDQVMARAHAAIEASAQHQKTA
jgi:hypothetical protein